jgi:hypothetical protein
MIDGFRCAQPILRAAQHSPKLQWAMMVRQFLPLVAAMMGGLLQCQAVAAQSVRQPRLGCDLYNQIDRHCNCRGADGYFISYGRRYCERFLTSTGWTPAGVIWRNNTMVCLQQSLRRALVRRPSGTCDCDSARAIAAQTHVSCYTQASVSVCRLPLSDLVKIYSTIDIIDAFAPYGLSQMIAIAGTCIQQRVKANAISTNP